MEIILVALITLLVWMIALTLILGTMDVNKIKAIGDFYKKVLPEIPFTKILNFFKGNKE